MSVGLLKFPDWSERLLKKKNGEPYANELNAMRAFQSAPELRGLLVYDDFCDRIFLTRPFNGQWKDGEVLSDAIVIALTAWLQEAVPVLRRDMVHAAIVLAGKSLVRHPVREYLATLKWDGQARLDSWLSRYLNARDDDCYLASVGPKFLIGAVARILNPGCQMDTILVLEGGQGIGKSSAVRILARKWSADITGDLASKDAAIHIQGVWIGEMSELSAIRRSDIENVKGFISRRIDRYRPPYGRHATERPRQTVFIATTNESEYLQDATGDRRFWPVDCGAIDLTSLETDADQLWAEAVHRHTAGEHWYLSAAEAVRAAAVQVGRQRVTPVDSVVLEYADKVRASGQTRIEMRELLFQVFELNTRANPGQAGPLGSQASRALMRDGWKRLKPTGRGQNRKQFYEWSGVSEIAEPHKPSQAAQAEMEMSDDIPF